MVASVDARGSVSDSPPITLLADDLTGACDAAAPFAAAGLSTSVYLAGGGLGSSVRAVDLNCRERTEEAKSRVWACARAARHTRIFLKIDSTLRGPIADMVDGVLAGSGRRCAIIAPAFPEQGRTIVLGRLLVHGVAAPDVPPLAESLAPALDEVERLSALPEEEMSSALRSIVDRSHGRLAIVVDAEDPAPLTVAAREWLRDPGRIVLVGSGGVARCAASLVDAPTSARRPAPDPGRSGPAVVVAGSPAAPTQRQLAELEERGNKRWLKVFRTPRPEQSATRDGGDAAEQAVAELVSWLEQGIRPSIVVLVGGRTARRVCERLGVTQIVLGGELRSGLPYGQFADGMLVGVPVVTKAGAFGEDDALLEAIAAGHAGCLLWNEPKETGCYRALP